MDLLPNEYKTQSVGKRAIRSVFVVGMQRQLAELMRHDLSGLPMVALTIDAVRFAEHMCDQED